MLTATQSSSTSRNQRAGNFVYADHAATTPVRQEVLEAMLPFFSECYGNPSGIHSFAHSARSAVAQARESVAQFVGAYNAKEIIFTSGGTESNSLALEGILRSRPPGRILTTELEHAAVYETLKRAQGQGSEVTYLPVDCHGVVSLKALEEQLDDSVVLVSVMLVNNEVGTIQPIAEIAKLVRRTQAVLHTDAVQAASFMSLDVHALDVDALTLSGHKIYGPKGVGALWIRSGLDLEPMVLGGGQEQGRRSGTENVPGIVGLGKATQLIRQESPLESGRLKSLTATLLAELPRRIAGCAVTGHPTERHPGIASFVIDGVEGESLLPQLDRRSVAASTGSACSTRTRKSSRVLEAMGVEHLRARGGLRISLGRGTTEQDVAKILEATEEAVRTVREA